MEALEDYQLLNEDAGRPNGIRRFLLIREQDVTGVSGTGIVAEGALFSSGLSVLSWLREPHAVGMYQSISALLAVHGHEGATQVWFIDQA